MVNHSDYERIKGRRRQSDIEFHRNARTLILTVGGAILLGFLVFVALTVWVVLRLTS